MRRQRRFLSLVTPLLLGVLAVIVAGTIPKGSIPTKGIFDNFGHNLPDSPTLRITGDSSEATTVYEHNVDGVMSFLSPKYEFNPVMYPGALARGFQINLNSTQPRRNLRFDFSDWITSSAPVPPMEKFNEGIFVVGNLPEVGCGVLDGGCLTTALFITPSPEGVRLRFNPDFGGNSVLATRTSANTWDVRTQEPDGFGVKRDAADLKIQTKGNKGQATETSLGTFHMPFHMTIEPK